MREVLGAWMKWRAKKCGLYLSPCGRERIFRVLAKRFSER
jgi:hypothetical protein